MTHELIHTSVYTLDQIGQIANSYAAQNVFTDYHERIAENTLKRQQADISLFTAYLNAAGVQPGNLFNEPDAWKNITHGLVTGFVRWKLNQGYAVNSINVRLATVKAY